MTIHKLLIANRGEIAVRIIRAARELGLATVQVYSKADKDSLAVRLADECVDIGAPQASKSYLNHDAILVAAKTTGADAIHPGYGFLAENAEFAAAVEAAGLIFVGPTAQSIRLMGDKVAAREAAAAAGVPTIPGSSGRLESPEAAFALVKTIGFPVMIKAAAGGGGRGIRIARSAEEFHHLMPQAQAEALADMLAGLKRRVELILHCGDIEDAETVQSHRQLNRSEQVLLIQDGYGTRRHDSIPDIERMEPVCARIDEAALFVRCHLESFRYGRTGILESPDAVVNSANCQTQDASTNAAYAPDVGPEMVPSRRAAVTPTTSTERMPASAGASRAVHSCTPKTLNATAVAQYWNGGFSKYLRPFRRGVTQLPETAISRAISAYRPSSGCCNLRTPMPANQATRKAAAMSHQAERGRDASIGPAFYLGAPVRPACLRLPSLGSCHSAVASSQ
jgi:hypothetical protein